MFVKDQESAVILSAESKNTNPSPEQVAAWERQYGKLRKVTVREMETDEDDALADNEQSVMTFYFRKISLTNLRIANNSLQKDKDGIKYADTLLKNTILNGDFYLDDSEVFLAFMPLVDKMLASKVAVLEKK